MYLLPVLNASSVKNYQSAKICIACQRFPVTFLKKKMKKTNVVKEK